MKVERLRALRERKGLTQGQAAKKMGIVRTTYSNYEAGNREPDHETLAKMADFFEVTVDYLLGKTNFPSDKVRNDLMDAYDRLPEAEKRIIQDMIKALEKQRNN